MRVELHGGAHHVCNLMKPAVVHIEEGLEDAALNRFETVVDIWNGSLFDNVGSVFQEIAIKELTKFTVL